MATNAKQIGAHVAMQVSAKTGDKVEKLFRDIGAELIKRDTTVSKDLKEVVAFADFVCF